MTELTQGKILDISAKWFLSFLLEELLFMLWMGSKSNISRSGYVYPNTRFYVLNKFFLIYQEFFFNDNSLNL